MNMVAPEAMPYPNAVGMRYDSGTYEANMDLVDADRRLGRVCGAAARGRGARQAARARPRATMSKSAIGAPNERTEITVTAEGRVRVVIGTGPSGQGHETSFAQVVGAAARRAAGRAIDLVTGDTDQVVSLGGGSHSGRSMRHAATLFAKAAPELIAKGKRVAARLLDVERRARLPLPMAGSRPRAATAASIFSNSAKEAAAR